MNLSGISLNSKSRYLSLRHDSESIILTGSSSTYTHGLESRPLVRLFYQSGDGRWYAAKTSTSSGSPRVPFAEYSVNTTSITISAVDGSGSIPIYYRLYTIDPSLTISTKMRIDKIFSTGSHTGTVPGTSLSSEPVQAVTTIPHGQTSAPLFTLQFSANNSDWYAEGTNIPGGFDTSSGPPGGPYSRYYYVTAFGSSDGTNFYITRQSNYSTTQTIYVRYALDFKV